jgi:hypothetical protein
VTAAAVPGDEDQADDMLTAALEIGAADDEAAELAELAAALDATDAAELAAAYDAGRAGWRKT